MGHGLVVQRQSLHVFSLKSRVYAHGLDIGHGFVAHVIDNGLEDVGVDAERGEIGEFGDEVGLVAAISGLSGGGGCARVIPGDDLATYRGCEESGLGRC